MSSGVRSGSCRRAATLQMLSDAGPTNRSRDSAYPMSKLSKQGDVGWSVDGEKDFEHFEAFEDGRAIFAFAGSQLQKAILYSTQEASLWRRGR